VTTAETGFQPRAIDELLALWTEVMPPDPPSPARLRDLVLLDPAFRPEGFRMLWLGDRLIGFGYAVAGRPEAAAAGTGRRGWLVGLGVAADMRRRGHGTRLLRSCLRFLAGAGCSRAELGGHGERYLVPGLDGRAYPEFGRLLLAAGFRAHGSTVAMECDLAGRTGPEANAGYGTAGRGGYCCRHPADGELPELLRVVADRFSRDWCGLIRAHLARSAANTGLWIARGPAGIVGFAGSDLFPGSPGRFGPMGVLEEARGQGIGGRLLRLTLASMAERGHRRAWFLWGPDGEAGRRMYASAGFRVTRRFEFLACDLTCQMEDP
jgi:mycothiol synthase